MTNPSSSLLPTAPSAHSGFGRSSLSRSRGACCWVWEYDGAKEAPAYTLSALPVLCRHRVEVGQFHRWVMTPATWVRLQLVCAHHGETAKRWWDHGLDVGQAVEAAASTRVAHDAVCRRPFRRLGEW